MMQEIDHNPEPPGLPGLGHNWAGAKDQRQEILDEFTRILLADRSADTPSFLDSIFQKTQLVRPGAQAASDVLLSDLFLFEEGRMPQHNNVFNADLGLLTERLVCALFKIALGDDVDITDESMLALQSEADVIQTVRKRKDGKTTVVQWKKADFLMSGSKIVECKYRFNSYDGKLKQIKVASIYADLGLTPVFLHLSPDFQHREDFEANGWKVYAGEEALDYIEAHTGFNLRDLFREVSARPIVRQRILGEHRALLERQKAQLWSDYYYAPDDIRDDFHTKVVANDRSLREIAEMIENSPPPIEALEAMALRERAELLCDTAARTLSQEKKDALLGLLMSLDQTQRAELLCEAIQASDETTRMTMLSIIG